MGDERQALDALFSITYEELRRLASNVLRDDRNATLTPTALVNEAWLKLARAPGGRADDSSAFQAHRCSGHAPSFGGSGEAAVGTVARQRRLPRHL